MSFLDFHDDALEAEVFEQLRQREIRRRRDSRPRWLRPLAANAAFVAFVTVVAVGYSSNVVFAQNLDSAHAEYTSAVRTLDAVYKKAQNAEASLSGDVAQAQDLLTSSRGAAQAAQGWVDPQPLAQLSSTVNLLSTAVRIPAGGAVRLIPAGTDDTPDLRAAAEVARQEARENELALTTTTKLAAQIAGASQRTRAALAVVGNSAATAADLMAQKIRRTAPDQKAQLFAAAATVNAALQTGNGLAAAIISYAQCAQTVTAAAGGMPATVRSALNLTPPASQPPTDPTNTDSSSHGHHDQQPAAATPPGPGAGGNGQAGGDADPPASVTGDLGSDTDTQDPAPAAITVTVHASGPVRMGCQHGSAPSGGGVYVGTPGSTQRVDLHYNRPYTYTVTQQSATSVLVQVFTCQN